VRREAIRQLIDLRAVDDRMLRQEITDCVANRSDP
jgi:hypothetical protein